jgi:hypothetical protein
MREYSSSRNPVIVFRNLSRQEPPDVIFTTTGPPEHNDTGKPEKLNIFKPRIHFQECIQTDQEEKLRTRKFLLKHAKRVDGVGFSRNSTLDIRKLKPRIAGNCKFQHTPAVLEGEDLPARFVRWRAGWNKQHMIEAEEVNSFLGRSQMTQMNWIEGPSHYAQPPWHFPVCSSLLSAA